jgi:hypothetical protein
MCVCVCVCVCEVVHLYTGMQTQVIEGEEEGASSATRLEFCGAKAASRHNRSTQATLRRGTPHSTSNQPIASEKKKRKKGGKMYKIRRGTP